MYLTYIMAVLLRYWASSITSLKSPDFQNYTEFQITRSYQYLWKHRQLKLSILKMPVIIKIDTSSNQVLGSAGEHIRLP